MHDKNDIEIRNFIDNLKLRNYEAFQRIPNEENKNKNEFEFMKTLLLGPSSSSKSETLMRYYENQYQKPLLATIGIDFRVIRYLIAGTKVKLQIFDTAGPDKYFQISMAYIRNVETAIIFFDVSDPNGLNTAKKYIELLHEHGPQDVLIYLNGSKCDLKCVIPQKTVQHFAIQNKIKKVFYTSAKANIGITDMFLTILNDRLNLIQMEINIILRLNDISMANIKIKELISLLQKVSSNSNFDDIQREKAIFCDIRNFFNAYQSLLDENY